MGHVDGRQRVRKRTAFNTVGVAGTRGRRAGGVVSGDRPDSGAPRNPRWGARLLVPFSVILICTLAVIGIIDRLATNERMAEQRDLRLRDSQLSVSALAPGSPLACLDGVAGEQVENACERAVFADAQSTARAVAYVTARLALLADVSAVAQRGDRDLLAAFANARRAIELDRYGIAAHVLAVRDGCTTERCAAFAMFQDTGALKANLKVRAFETYVARYASAWGKSEPGADKEPQASGRTAAARRERGRAISAPSGRQPL